MAITHNRHEHRDRHHDRRDERHHDRPHHEDRHDRHERHEDRLRDERRHDHHPHHEDRHDRHERHEDRLRDERRHDHHPHHEDRHNRHERHEDRHGNQGGAFGFGNDGKRDEIVSHGVEITGATGAPEQLRDTQPEDGIGIYSQPEDVTYATLGADAQQQFADNNSHQVSTDELVLEGNIVPNADFKEEAKRDVQEAATRATFLREEQVGSGEHAAARSHWSAGF